jgi:hypothetical protein
MAEVQADRGTVKQDNLVVQVVVDVLLTMDLETHTVTVLQIAVNDVLAVMERTAKDSQVVRVLDLTSKAITLTQMVEVAVQAVQAVTPKTMHTKAALDTAVLEQPVIF